MYTRPVGVTVLPVAVERQTLIDAQQFIRHSEMPLELKKQWDLGALAHYVAAFGWSKANIPIALRGEEGRVLSRWGEPVWGALLCP